MKKLRNRHYEMIRLAFLGTKQAEIARELGVTDATVSIILNSPLAQAELSRLRMKSDAVVVEAPLHARLRTRLERAASDAVTLNHSLMMNDGVAIDVRRKAATHFMDRVIFDAEQESKQETSYKDILRELSSIQHKLGDGVDTLVNVTPTAAPAEPYVRKNTPINLPPVPPNELRDALRWASTAASKDVDGASNTPSAHAEGVSDNDNDKE